MKWIEYQVLCNKDKNIFIDKKLEYTDANLAIALQEAYNGQYYIVEDAKVFDKKPLGIEFGGTGATNAQDALINLGAAKKSDYDEIEEIVSEVEKEQKATLRLVEFLHKLEHGVKYAFEEDSEMGYHKDIPSGAKMVSIQQIGGANASCPNLLKLIEGSETELGITFTVTSDSITINGMATTDWVVPRPTMTIANITLPAGTYTINGDSKASASSFYVEVVTTNAANGTRVEHAIAMQDDVTFTINQITTAQVNIVVPCQTYYRFENYVVRYAINKGTKALPFVPYFEGADEVKVTAVKSIGKNIFDINASHTTVNDELYKYEFIGKPRTKYTFSTNVPQSTPANILANGEDSVADGIYAGRNKTITTDVTGCIMCEVRYKASGTGSDVYTSLLNGVYYLQIEEGETASEYTPYFCNTLSIPSGVQALEGYGVGWDESLYNYIDWVEQKFYKYIGVIDMATLEWTQTHDITSSYPESTAVYHASVPMKAPGIINFKVSNAVLYDITNTSLATLGQKQMTGSSADSTIHVKDSSYFQTNAALGAANFRNSLSGKMLFYELISPVCLDISDILTDDNLIEVQGHGSLIFVSEHKISVPNKEEYLIDLMEVVS